jgi:hypothetical protein
MNLSLQLEKNRKEDINYDLSQSLNDPLLYDDEMINSLQDLNEIQQNLSSLVASQQEKIDTIEENITKTEIQARKGLEDLREADRLFFSYKPILIGGALGALVGGPVGAAIGVKWVSLSGGIGTLVGSYSGYKLQKH